MPGPAPTTLTDAKLRALVRAHWGEVDAEEARAGTLAALRSPDASWVLLDAEPATDPSAAVDPLAMLGVALWWLDAPRPAPTGDGADPAAAGHLLVDAGAAPVAARRVAEFAAPRPTVWAVTPRSTELVVAAPAPCPVPPRPAAAPELERLLGDAGLEIVVEDGIVRGERAGLEVARIVHGQTTAGVPIHGPQLEVGVGAADRELTAMVHGDLAPTDRLRRVVEMVDRWRRDDAPRHPLNVLVPERWLRSALVASPGAIGLSHLAPAPMAVPRANLRARGAAAATGTTPEGASVVVVASVGVDPDLVPAAADTRATLDPSADLWLVVPERDQHAMTRSLAARLARPARLVTPPGDWRRRPGP